jgi:predicted DCC family thiol-disulfide oxidoreductase YuxK
MTEAGRLILFYDGECGLCDAAVQLLLKIDRKKRFHFAPLQGKTAKKVLIPPPTRDSLVLWEPQRRSMEGSAVLRILWLLGGGWALIGWMYWLPSLPFDGLYRLIAKNRHRFFQPPPFCDLPPRDGRFLD